MSAKRGVILVVTSAITWVPLMLVALVIGCAAPEDRDSDTAPAGEVVRSEQERGPVKFVVEISPAKPRLSDLPQLTLTLEAAPGVRIEKPPFGEALGEFLIRDFHEPVPEVTETVERLRQVYTLEPTRAGKLTVAPIAVLFYDERPGADGKQHRIESEALTVEVSTMLGESAPTLADLRPLAGPVELSARSSTVGWTTLAIAALLAVIGVALWRARRRSSVAEPQQSPQALAWLELERLIQANLAETDVKQYYVELTGVVRRYIERSTGVQAPEQTTEEFLREIVENAVFAEDDSQRLRDFLESADMVKFAALEPGVTEIETSFQRAKQFIRLERATAQEVAA